MRSVIRRAVVAAGAMVVVLGTGAGVAAAGSQAAVPGAQLWASRYNGPGNGPDQANSVAVSPDGKTVFVTGYSQGATSTDYATIAYSTATGAKL